MELILIRAYHNKGTNGMLFCEESFQYYTIELPWLNNEQQHSCIPEGRYRLLIRNSPRHGMHFMLDNVKDRALILIHAANDALKELRGCIAPVSFLTGEGRGIQSRLALDKLKKLVVEAIAEAPIFITIKSKQDECN